MKADPASVPMDKSIAEPPLKADELDLVEIVMELEERLKLEISDAAIENTMVENLEEPCADYFQSIGISREKCAKAATVETQEVGQG